MYEYAVELFFYRKDSNKKELGLQKTPLYSEYDREKNKTKMMHFATWEPIENEVLRRFPNVAYIHILKKELLCPVDTYIKRYQTLHLKIKDSKLHGKGVFINIPVEKGGEIISLGGELIDITKMPDGALYPQGEWNAISETLYLFRRHRTIYGFVNHSRTPNAEISFNDYKIRALRDLQVGEELTIDYRKETLSKAYLSGHGATYL